ncbi:MAG: ABC transporter permease, partial [Candidatus Woesearchaeota archaeon]
MADLRKILAIARFETKKHRTKDEKKVILILLMLGLLVYGSVSLFMELGIAGNEVFYRFSTEDETIKEILESTGKFQETPEAEADIYIESDDDHFFIFVDSTDRGKAAVFSLKSAIKDFNNDIYGEYDKMYAFPLRINVIEVERDGESFDSEIGKSMGMNQEDAKETDNNDDMVDTETPEDKTADKDRSETDKEKENGKEKAEDNKTGINTDTRTEDDEELIEEDYMSAQDINPFAQFNVLIIVIILTLPLAMIALVYSNSMMAEKINKRGIFLLMSPINRLEMITGKTLPYFLISISIFLPVIISNTSSISSALYASIISIAVILAYLAISFLSAMVSRSHKELSFIAIFFISLYSCYLLVPAFMMNFSLISLASPLTIIAKTFRGEMINIQTLFFSVIPTLVSAFVIFFAGSRLINDTNMFSYESISKKISSGIYSIVRHRIYNIILISFFSVPLIFLIQLMMIVVLLSLRNMSALFLLMFFGALVEELFKNIAPYTLIERDRKGASTRRLLLYALLTGLGFFIAEKTLMLIMIGPFLEAYSALIMTGFLIPFISHTSISFIFCLS